MKTPEEKIRELILKEREKQGMTYRELSIRAGISIQAIFHWKQGGGITIDAADRALKALGITAEIGSIDGDKNSND